MKVLVDTSVWSAVLRRNRPDPKLTAIVTELIKEGRILVVGPIRQELLSGIKEKAQFEKLKKRLAAFPDVPLETKHFELAAQFYNTCRAKGVQGSHIDYLLCAVCDCEQAAILTKDKDFEGYAKHLGIRLYVPEP